MRGLVARVWLKYPEAVLRPARTSNALFNASRSTASGYSNRAQACKVPPSSPYLFYV